MGAVGVFWFVGDILVAAGCSLDAAVAYGDCLTYDGGHADHWERWQEAGARWLAEHGLPAAILTSEYDDHPRGRVVKEPTSFVLYADRRLQTPARLMRVRQRFGIEGDLVVVRSDPHYRRQALGD